MEGKFKLKYESKEEFDYAVEKWVKLMETWKTSDSDFKRDFKMVRDEENLKIIVEINTDKILSF